MYESPKVRRFLVAGQEKEDGAVYAEEGMAKALLIRREEKTLKSKAIFDMSFESCTARSFFSL